MKMSHNKDYAKCKHLESENINEPVDYDPEHGYSIRGCCGGGCYVIYDFRYCPFCGEKL